MGRLWVRHAPESAALVRRTVTAALRDAAMSPEQAFEGALVASELVSNAVRHARALPSGHLLISWNIDSDSYTLAVTDGGSDRVIAPRHAQVTDTSGRGLAIVAEFCDAWGVSHAENGSTTVWASRTYAPAERVGDLVGSGRR